MKITITIILLLVIAGLFATVYFSNRANLTDISVLRDVTEKHLSQPESAEILPLFGLDQNKWNGGDFRFGNISDVSYTPAREVKIGSANQWLSNEYDRANEIKGFYSDITKTLTDAQNDSVGKWHSSVYMPVAMELNRLSQSKATRRILLVYSDLMENDPNFSFYKDETLNQLASNYNLLSKKLNELMPLQNLSGIEIHLLYEPPNVVSDGRYKIVSAFYKKLLESKGATVTISANLL